MKMNTIKPIRYLGFILAIILIIVGSSCEEEIDLSLDNQEYARLVVEGSITTDTTAHKVRLTKTSDYYHAEPAPAVSGATVQINNGDSIITLAEDMQDLGSYYTDSTYYGEIFKTYTLTISNVDIDEDNSFETYTSTSTMPGIADLDSIQVFYTEYSQFYKGWEIHLWAIEPAETKDFYFFRARINDHLVTDTISEFGFSDDLGINGQNTNGIPTYMFLDNVDLKPDEQVAIGDKITFEMGNMTEDFYDFMNALVEELYNVPLFGGPPANIPTNIINSDPDGLDCVGYFTTYSIGRVDRIYNGEIAPL